MLRERHPDAPGPAEGRSDEPTDGTEDGGEQAVRPRRGDAARSAAPADEDLPPGSPRRAAARAGRGRPRPRSALAPCAVPALAEGPAAVAGRFDGDPATLVLRAATGGTREAQIYACDNGDALLAQRTVPAPLTAQATRRGDVPHGECAAPRIR